MMTQAIGATRSSFIPIMLQRARGLSSSDRPDQPLRSLQRIVESAVCGRARKALS
jgi:hypothetical protein